MKIYVSRVLPGSKFKEFVKTYHPVVNKSPYPPTEEELLREMKDKEGVITLLTDRVTKEILQNCSHLKIIANYAVGYDNIDVEYATQLGIMVTNTPDVLTTATAELTWALILSVARRIVAAHTYTVEGNFSCWTPDLFLGKELGGKIIGIIGAGRIGTKVGEIAYGFGMKILYTDLKRNERLEKLGAKRVSLEELLKQGDVISIHLPLNETTYKLIGKKELFLIKKGSILINTARGKIIDEWSLISLLKDGRLAGVGLDVYEDEPQIKEEFKNLKNVTLLPHIGSATYSAREKMAELVIDNLLKGLKGEEPPNLVNKEVWGKH
jgi:glyoxylate reductase